LTEHKKHIDFVLEALHKTGLQLDIDKCEFYKMEILYFGLIISINNIQMDLKKIKVIINR